MKAQLKISGKKSAAPDIAPEEIKNWSFERRPGGWIIAAQIKTGERVRFHYEKVKKQFWFKAGTNEFFGESVETNHGGHGTQSAGDLTAQFPGKVRKVMVTADQQVEANTPLLMVEAMKMEFAIKAPAKGKVKKVLVTEGQQLTPGQQLIDFEETE